MKFAIFDGIQETHVASSLERSLKRRGHLVFNTGKIGHGFRFPKAKDDTGQLDAAVYETIGWQPDVVFVMRPASLPFLLLNKLRKTGATLVAWFSDDPVLFDLTYGPVVESYDLVLHCGNAAVLRFYENEFGRPTGVNFPFWTDHDAFPYSWGKELPTTDFMFLGNVDGSVRRRRYFDLGRLQSSIRVHGRIGTDYLGLSGGYLENDELVAAAAASTLMALNIPQFFEDHRGLETWFTGLGDLGYFEYPSRVVQYMALGIPTISLLPFDAEFRSYPEMAVVTSVEEADSTLMRLSHDGGLQGLSEATGARFDANFSADSRVLALESLLSSDDWKTLDPEEREVWFSQFDATRMPEAEPGEGSGKSEDSAIEVVGGDDIEIVTAKALRVAVFGNGKASSYSRFSEVRRALEELGHSVTGISAGDHMSTLVSDPQKLTRHALNVGKLADRIGLRNYDVLVICGIDLALTAAGKQFVDTHRIITIFFDDQPSSNLHRAARIAEGVHALAVGSKLRYEALTQRGFGNIHYIPKFVNPDFLFELRNCEEVHETVHVRRSIEREFETCPALAVEAETVQGTAVQHYNSLQRMSLDEAAKALRSRVTFMSYQGTFSRPELDDLMPYAAVAADSLIVSRTGDLQYMYPYPDLGLTVSELGELRAKVRWYEDSVTVQEIVERSRSVALPLICNGEQTLESLLDILVDADLANQDNRRIRKGTTVRVKLTDTTPEATRTNSARITFPAPPDFGSSSDWSIRIKTTKGKSKLVRSDSTAIRVASVSSLEDLQVEYVYVGEPTTVSVSLLHEVSAQVERSSIELQQSGGFAFFSE